MYCISSMSRSHFVPKARLTIVFCPIFPHISKTVSISAQTHTEKSIEYVTQAPRVKFRVTLSSVRSYGCSSPVPYFYKTSETVKYLSIKVYHTVTSTVYAAQPSRVKVKIALSSARSHGDTFPVPNFSKPVKFQIAQHKCSQHRDGCRVCGTSTLNLVQGHTLSSKDTGLYFSVSYVPVRSDFQIFWYK